MKTIDAFKSSEAYEKLVSMFKADVPDMIHYENVRDGLALESRVI
jgi:hypothetical protein